MTTGWPDAERPGVPLNPERYGWHWLKTEDGELFVGHWSADEQMWFATDERDCYVEPCLTPAEVAALVEAARREEREACAAIADAGAPTKHWQDYHSQEAALRAEGQEAASEHIAAAIRARGAA